MEGKYQNSESNDGIVFVKFSGKQEQEKHYEKKEIYRFICKKTAHYTCDCKEKFPKMTGNKKVINLLMPSKENFDEKIFKPICLTSKNTLMIKKMTIMIKMATQQKTRISQKKLLRKLQY